MCRACETSRAIRSARSRQVMPPTSGEAHFYEALITFALEGYLGDPSYGGNKDRGGWAVVGFNPGAPMPAMPGMPGMKKGGG